MRTSALLTWLPGFSVAVASLCSAVAAGADQPESAEYAGCVIWGPQERVFRPEPFDGPEEWAVMSVPDDFETDAERAARGVGSAYGISACAWFPWSRGALWPRGDGKTTAEDPLHPGAPGV